MFRLLHYTVFVYGFFIFYFLLLVELTEEMGLHYEKSLFCFYFV